MNIYKISPINYVYNWETYSDAVVIAPSVEEAAKIHPANHVANWDEAELDYDQEIADCNGDEYRECVVRHAWCQEGSWVRCPDQVTVQLIGTACPDMQPGIITASYHNG